MQLWMDKAIQKDQWELATLHRKDKDETKDKWIDISGIIIIHQHQKQNTTSLSKLSSRSNQQRKIPISISTHW